MKFDQRLYYNFREVRYRVVKAIDENYSEVAFDAWTITPFELQKLDRERFQLDSYLEPKGREIYAREMLAGASEAFEIRWFAEAQRMVTILQRPGIEVDPEEYEEESDLKFILDPWYDSLKYDRDTYTPFKRKGGKWYILSSALSVHLKQAGIEEEDFSLAFSRAKEGKPQQLWNILPFLDLEAPHWDKFLSWPEIPRMPKRRTRYVSIDMR